MQTSHILKSKALSVIADAFMYCFIAASVFFLIFDFYDPLFGSGEFTVRGTVNLYPDNWSPENVDIPNSTASLQRLTNERSFVKISTGELNELLVWSKLKYIVLNSSSIFLWVMVVFNITRIIKSFRSSGPFVTQNVIRFRWIAACLALIPFSNILTEKAFVDIVREVLVLDAFLIDTSSGFDERLILVSIIIFLMSEAFNYGSSLQEENNLTV